MNLIREKALTRTLGFSLILGGIIVLSMTYSEGIDNDKGFYKVVATFLLISGVYLCFAHNWKTDEELEWKLIVSFLLLFAFLTFGICFFKAYDDIISEKSNIFVPGVTSQGTCVIVMSLCFALSFAILCIIINQLMYKKTELDYRTLTEDENAKPYANSPSEAAEKYYYSSVSKGDTPVEALENIKKFFTNTINFDKTDETKIIAAENIDALVKEIKELEEKGENEKKKNLEDLDELLKDKDLEGEEREKIEKERERKRKGKWGRDIEKHFEMFDRSRKLTESQEASLAQIQLAAEKYKDILNNSSASPSDIETFGNILSAQAEKYLSERECPGDRSENIKCRKDINELFKKLDLVDGRGKKLRVREDPKDTVELNPFKGPDVGF